jgi:tetratricopeptide (TPR) repeat protein
MNKFTVSAKRIGSIISLSLVIALGALGVSSLAHAADKKDKQEKVEGPRLSAKVAAPLQEAWTAITKKDFEAATKKIDEAASFSKKTPYDEFKIAEFRAIVFSTTNMPEAITIYEKSLANPEFLTPEEIAGRPLLLAQLYFNTKNYPKAIENGKRWLEKNSNDQVSVLVGKAQYLSQDYKGTIETFEALIASTEAANKVPEELWFQLINSSASPLNDQPKVLATYERLVRYYPKPEYWGKLMERVYFAEKNDFAMLNVFRLMADTGVKMTAENYMEYAQIAADKAMPGEALRVLELGFEKNVLGADEKNKAKQQLALADAKKKAAADKAQLPEIEKEAAGPKATTGQLSAGLGLAYFSFGMTEQAVAAIEAGLKKGGLKNIDDYRMVLGIAKLRLGDKEAARAVFQSVPSNSPYARIASIWTIRTYN